MTSRMTSRMPSTTSHVVLAMVRHLVSTLLARRQIAQEVRVLLDRAIKLGELSKRYQLPVPSGVTATSSPPGVPLPTELCAETTNLVVVGIDGQRDEVIAKLLSATTRHESGCRRVASMVGFAGVGKTTLARAVYCSLKNRFQCRAFVTVSRKFDAQRVLKDILQQVITSTGSSSMPDPGIASVDKWEVSKIIVDKIQDDLKDKR